MYLWILINLPVEIRNLASAALHARADVHPLLHVAARRQRTKEDVLFRHVEEEAEAHQGVIVLSFCCVLMEAEEKLNFDIYLARVIESSTHIIKAVLLTRKIQTIKMSGAAVAMICRKQLINHRWIV